MLEIDDLFAVVEGDERLLRDEFVASYDSGAVLQVGDSGRVARHVRRDGGGHAGSRRFGRGGGGGAVALLMLLIRYDGREVLENLLFLSFLLLFLRGSKDAVGIVLVSSEENISILCFAISVAFRVLQVLSVAIATEIEQNIQQCLKCLTRHKHPSIDLQVFDLVYSFQALAFRVVFGIDAVEAAETPSLLDARDIAGGVAVVPIRPRRKFCTQKQKTSLKKTRYIKSQP